MIIDPSILAPRERYRLLISTAALRPIAWVETSEFVINIVTEELAERMNLTSGDWPQETSEDEHEVRRGV